MVDCTDVAIVAGMVGIRENNLFWHSLQKKPLRTYAKFLNYAHKYINVEEAVLDGQKVVKLPQLPKEKDSRKRKPNNRSGNPQTRKQKRPYRELELRPLRSRVGKNDNYHELTMNVEEVFARARDRLPFKKPTPIRKKPAKGNQNQYC